MLVDRSHPGKKPVINPLPVREIPKEPLSFRPQKQTCETSQKMKMKTDEDNDKNFLELGENFRELMETDSGSAKKLACPKCPASRKLDLRKHLEKEHKGIMPNCNICKRRFKTLVRYLDDQFRHVGVSPYYCACCQIYEMTERSEHSHKKPRQEEVGPKPAMKTGGQQR
ncbi:hypothetical protein XENOCAPTIV_002361 [Xenoophorus captivus]|uniref:C2H2-type domain-containing protein n=1 Tax=Xenoophorus captivus TaxID=1517983 RepID=A0ABV0QY62_9TELE